MYIEPLTLFIIGEFVVVYIIINIFLFYNSRLYKVLSALLKEMRFDKLRREQLKRKELEALRASNKGLLSTNKRLEKKIKSAGKTIDQQLREHLDSIIDADKTTDDNGLDQPLSQLRMRILQLEQSLLSGEIDEKQWQARAKQLLSPGLGAQSAQIKSANQPTYTAEMIARAAGLEKELEETAAKLQHAEGEVTRLALELDQIRSISIQTENPFAQPTASEHDEELYQLKNENFEQQENINRLALKLQELDATKGDELEPLLKEQIHQMERYIKNADIAQELLEVKVNALRAKAESLQDVQAAATTTEA